MHRVDRVLDVRQGELCWVAGTVYMDMPLKPNILDDISKDVCAVTRWNASHQMLTELLALDCCSASPGKICLSQW